MAVVLAMIFVGAKVGSIVLGIYGMVGVFVLVFCFGLEPGVIPVDVMLIIVCVITASSALQAAGGLDYMVGVAAKFLKRHPSHITFYAPFVTWLFCFLAGTAHTCYALLPIISEIAYKEKVRPERPLSVATVAAIGFDRTGTTTVGKYVINHSFQLSGFITTFVSIGVGYLLCCCLLTA